MKNEREQALEQALELAYVALSETVQHLTGYDWNADPLGLTRKQGDAFTAMARLRPYLPGPPDSAHSHRLEIPGACSMQLPANHIRVYQARAAGEYTVIRVEDGNETDDISHPQTLAEVIDDVNQSPNLAVVCSWDIAEDLDVLGFDPDDSRVIVEQ